MLSKFLRHSMKTLPYDNLSPDLILTAVEKQGFTTTGHLLALYSYENRVYEVGVEECKRVVVKFYRPKRWTDAAILEEHAFCFELGGREIPVVAPLKAEGKSLHFSEDHRYALFPAKGGRAPEIENEDTLKILGHFIGRIHAVGGVHAFKHRPTLNIQHYGYECTRFLLENNFLPGYLKASYESITHTILQAIENAYRYCDDLRSIRIHADLHVGNILMDLDIPHIVDLDDCRRGPAIQDIWMLLSTDLSEREKQLSIFLEAYNEFYDFNMRELHLIEPLRTLRMIHYSAWLARRWHDPAFPKHFPWFGNDRYWEGQIADLKEQLSFLQEPPISLIKFQ